MSKCNRTLFFFFSKEQISIFRCETRENKNIDKERFLVFDLNRIYFFFSFFGADFFSFFFCRFERDDDWNKIYIHETNNGEKMKKYILKISRDDLCRFGLNILCSIQQFFCNCRIDSIIITVFGGELVFGEG